MEFLPRLSSLDLPPDAHIICTCSLVSRFIFLSFNFLADEFINFCMEFLIGVSSIFLQMVTQFLLVLLYFYLFSFHFTFLEGEFINFSMEFFIGSSSRHKHNFYLLFSTCLHFFSLNFHIKHIGYYMESSPGLHLIFLQKLRYNFDSLFSSSSFHVPFHNSPAFHPHFSMRDFTNSLSNS